MKRLITFSMIALLGLILTAGVSGQQENADLERPAVPRGFGDLLLGLSLEEARSRLQGNTNFMYRGAPDVSLRPFDQERSIESEGRGFMERGAFLFEDDYLYIITLFLDSDRLDYFTIYRTLQSEYGDPDELSPDAAIWEDEATRMSLERPLTVKYVDLQRFRAQIEEGQMEESVRAQMREIFLEQF